MISSLYVVITVSAVFFILYTVYLRTMQKEASHALSVWEHEFNSRHDHEPETNQLLFELGMQLPPNSAILDAGAHVGDTGIRLAKRLNDAGRNDIKVLEVDPDPSKIEFIKNKAIEWNVSNMIVTCVAGLYNRNTKGKIIKKTMDGNNAPDGSRESGQWQIVEDEKQGDIMLKTLDSIIQTVAPANPIKLIHLDVEGSEYDALQGAKQTMLANRSDIIMEINNDLDNKAQRLLNEWGYKADGKRMGRDQLFRLI